jgi:hypothetical protein
MVLMPGGHDVPISRFFAEHGDKLKSFADTKVAVAIPPFKTPNEVGDAAEAAIGLAVGACVIALTKSASAEKYVGPIVTAFVAKDAAAWVKHHLDHGSEVKMYTLGELFPSIGHEAKDGWAVAAAAGRDVMARQGKMPEAMSASMMSARAATTRP